MNLAVQNGLQQGRRERAIEAYPQRGTSQGDGRLRTPLKGVFNSLYMNCTKCKTKAVIGLPRHNAAFCKLCMTEFVHEQVARAIKSERMFGPDDRILVAVSGGKDSLTLWHILLALGYRADALYVDLGIPGYSDTSHEKVSDSPPSLRSRREKYRAYVQEQAGAGIRELAMLIHRPTCSTCGTIKRYQFNRAAVEQNYDVMATGHNLDDEAARLLGNVLHWQTEYLEKQGPSLPASVEGFAKKVKPLYRLSEREIAAYAVLNRIDYIVEECPMAKGSKMLLTKRGQSSRNRIARHQTAILLRLSRTEGEEGPGGGSMRTRRGRRSTHAPSAASPPARRSAPT